MAYKGEKHGRDHCPGGADEIPCLGGQWIRRRFWSQTAVQTIGSGNDVALTYDDVVGSSNYEDYYEIFSATQIKILQKGTYAVSAQWLWDTVFTGVHLLILNDGFSQSCGFHFNDAGGSDKPMHGFTHIHRYPANQTLLLSAFQNSGVNNTLSQGYFEIYRLGSYSGADPTSAEE